MSFKSKLLAGVVLATAAAFATGASAQVKEV